MESVLFKGGSKEDLELLVQLAKKLGITARYLDQAELEDYGLRYTISKGLEEPEIDLESFKKTLGGDAGRNSFA